MPDLHDVVELEGRRWWVSSWARRTRAGLERLCFSLDDPAPGRVHDETRSVLESELAPTGERVPGRPAPWLRGEANA